MIDNKQFQQVNQATSDEVNSSHETSQTVADSLVTLQDCYLRLVLSSCFLFLMSFPHRKSNRSLSWCIFSKNSPKKATCSPL